MKKKEEIIEMSRYVEAEEIHPKCEGCDRVFDWSGVEGTIVIQKCRVYLRPSKWWEEKPVATKKVLVHSKEHPKGIMEELPVMDFRCPMATHVAAQPTASQPKVNPLKASKRGRR
jgi:hypothetical protein